MSITKSSIPLRHKSEGLFGEALESTPTSPSSGIHSTRLIQHITAIRKLSDLTVYCLKSIESAFFLTNKITEFSPPANYIDILDKTAGQFLIDSTRSFERNIENKFVTLLSGITDSYEFINEANLIIGEMQETQRISSLRFQMDEEALSENFSMCNSILDKIEEFKDDFKFAPDSNDDSRDDTRDTMGLSKTGNKQSFNFADSSFELTKIQPQEPQDNGSFHRVKHPGFLLDLTKPAIASENSSVGSDSRRASARIGRLFFEKSDEEEAFTFCGSKAKSDASRRFTSNTVSTVNRNHEGFHLDLGDITQTLKKNSSFYYVPFRHESIQPVNENELASTERYPTGRGTGKKKDKRIFGKRAHDFNRPPLPKSNKTSKKRLKRGLLEPVNVIELSYFE